MADNDQGTGGQQMSRSTTPSFVRRFFSINRSRRGSTRCSNLDQGEQLPIPFLCSIELTPSIHLELPVRHSMNLDRIRRWFMFNEQINDESNYLRTLILLTQDCYDVMIQDETILSRSTAREIFAYLPEMRVLHQHYRVWMAEGVRHWNEREMMGWVFGALLEQPALLQTYIMFVSNYKRAISVAQPELKKSGKFCSFMESRIGHVEPKLIFKDFFIKPSQWMAQMDRQIDEIIRITPTYHPDLPMLRLCSLRVKYIDTQLRVQQEHIDSLRSVLEPGFPATIPAGRNGRKWRQSTLLYCEDLCKTVVNRRGRQMEKIYRIFLLNDRVACVVVRKDRLETKTRLKWTLPLAEIKFQTVSPSGAYHDHNAEYTDAYMKMVRLMLDSSNIFNIWSRAVTLNHPYSGLSLYRVDDIQSKCDIEMQRIDDDARIADECYNSCQLLVSTRQDTSRGSRGKTHLVQFPDSASKRRWYVNARLAQRALQTAPYSSVWWTDVDQLLATYEPVFVDKLSPGTFQAHSRLLTCGCYYAPNLAAPLYVQQPLNDWLRNRRTLWICTSSRSNTTVTLYTHELLSNALVHRTQFCLDNVHVECIVHVPRGRVVLDDVSTEDTVWMGSKNRLMIYSGSYPLLNKQLVSRSMKGSPVQMLHRADRVYVGLKNGNVLIYQKGPTSWNIQMPLVVKVCYHSIASLLAINDDVYVAAGTSVSVIDGKTDRLRGQIKDEDEHVDGDAQAFICMGYSVNGMWLVRNKSSVVSLYRLSPWKHLQDIDLTEPVRRFSQFICKRISERQIFVTSIALIDNSLWIGTSVGVTMMMALPARRNVPLIGDILHGAKHGHVANVNIMLPLITAEDLINSCLDEDEAGYEAFDLPPANDADGSGESPLPTDNEYDSTSSLYDTVRTSAERSSGQESIDTEFVPIDNRAEQASYTGTIPKPRVQTAWHQLENTSSARGSPSFAGTIPEPPERVSLASEPIPPPVCTQVADTNVPCSVLILAGGEGYLNWHKLETMAARPYTMESSIDPEIQDDSNSKTSHIVVWEKRLDTPF